jgi:hypothetical protein
MPREVRTNPEVVREVWRRYFPKIALTDTRWYEIHDSVFLAENFKIAAENITGGKHLRALDEENVGKYVMGIIRKRRKGQIVRRTSRRLLKNHSISTARCGKKQACVETISNCKQECSVMWR